MTPTQCQAGFLAPLIFSWNAGKKAGGRVGGARDKDREKEGWGGEMVKDPIVLLNAFQKRH